MKRLLLYLLLTSVGTSLMLESLLSQGLDDDFQNNRKWQMRRKMRLEAYRDENGKVRPDLWKKGVEKLKQMQIDAGRTLPPASASGGAASAALGYLVTGVQWTQIGPQPAFPIAEINFQGNGPMSGEVLNIAIDPRGTYDKVIYIATNSGGIWRSVDGGVTFEPKTDYMPSLSMGAVALDPGNPSIVYAGTGNLFDGNGNRFAGPLSVKAVGLYKSIDMGESWTILNPGGIFNGVGINRIVFPAPGVLLVASSSGVFRSIDGGVNFGDNAPFFDDGDPIIGGFISDIDLDTADPANTVYASVRSAGVFMSTDAGVSFPTNLFSNPGAPTAGTFAFVALAQAETDPGRMYATVQLSTGGFDGLYRTDNGGGTWTEKTAADSPGADNGGCQCGYDQTVGVDPLNADIVFIGFQELYRSDDGGDTFSSNDVSRNKIHWDHHAITFSPPSHRGSDVLMWIGTDGGVHSSDNYDTGTSANVAFNNDHNITIATNLFTDIDMGTSSLMGDSSNGYPNSSYVYGGTQDTGTLHHNLGTDNSLTDTLWEMGINGDGGGVAVDTEDAEIAFGGGNKGCIRTSDGGQSWSNVCPGMLPNFVWRYAVDFNDPNLVWALQDGNNAGFDPGNALYFSNDRGLNFNVVPEFIPGANVWAVANTPSDSNVLWFGLTDGTVYYTTNALSGTPVFTSVAVPGRPGGGISAIAINPLNSDEVVVTYRGVCGAGTCTNSDNRQKRIFRTTDQGGTWVDISGTDGNPAGNLPNLPMNSVVYDTGTTPPTIIVSNDAGVLKTSNNGQTWEIFGYGLPTVEGTRLRIDNSTNPGLLRLGTYGRSVFELTAAQGPILAVNSNLAFGTLCLGGEATQIVQLFNVGSEDLVINAFFLAEGSTDFQVIGPSTPVVIQPGEELDFTVRYTATSPGDQTAVFQINSTDQFFPSKEIFASATGNTPQISTVFAKDGIFPDTCYESFSDLNLTVANVGCGFLEVSSILSSSTQFDVATVSGFPLTVEEGNSIKIPIRFEPNSSPCGVTRTADLTVVSNDPATPNKVVSVEGDVPCPDLNAAIANSGSFGAVCEGSQADLDLTLFNQGACNLTISNISLSGTDSGDFVLPDDLQLPLVLSPDADFMVPVRFEPDPAKSCSNDTPREANIEITSNSPGESPLVIPISGMVPCPNLVIDPAGLEQLYAFPATVVDTGAALGCFSDRQLTLRNTGACPMIIDDITTGGDANFAVLTPTLFPIELPPGEETLEVTVRFTPQTGADQRVADAEVTGLLTVAVDDIDDGTADLCGEGVVQSGVRFLVTDVSTGSPIALSTVEDIRVSSKGKNTPSPYGTRYSNAPLVETTICGNAVAYHVDLEELPSGSTSGNNPKASYEVSAKNGNLQTKQSFSINQCDFLELQLQLTTENGGGKGKGGGKP